jgi:hypothetical protein
MKENNRNKFTKEIEFELIDESKTKDTDMFFEDEKEKQFYFDLSFLALSKFPEEYIIKYDFKNLFNKVFSSLQYLGFYDEKNKVKNYLICLDEIKKYFRSVCYYVGRKSKTTRMGKRFSFYAK